MSRACQGDGPIDGRLNILRVTVFTVAIMSSTARFDIIRDIMNTRGLIMPHTSLLMHSGRGRAPQLAKFSIFCSREESPSENPAMMLI